MAGTVIVEQQRLSSCAPEVSHRTIQLIIKRILCILLIFTFDSLLLASQSTQQRHLSMITTSQSVLLKPDQPIPPLHGEHAYLYIVPNWKVTIGPALHGSVNLHSSSSRDLYDRDIPNGWGFGYGVGLALQLFYSHSVRSNYRNRWRSTLHLMYEQRPAETVLDYEDLIILAPPVDYEISDRLSIWYPMVSADLLLRRDLFTLTDDYAKIGLQAGPSAAYVVGLVVDSYVQTIDSDRESKHGLRRSIEDRNPFRLAAKGGVYVELFPLIFSLNYDYPLTEVAPSTSGEADRWSVKSIQLGVDLWLYATPDDVRMGF